MNYLADLPEEIKQEIDDSMGIIELVLGELDHKPFWAYVSMYPTTYQEYRQKTDALETVNLEEYGIVIDKGWGKLPPEDVQERMKISYGADHTLQDQLTKMAEEIYLEHHQENDN